MEIQNRKKKVVVLILGIVSCFFISANPFSDGPTINTDSTIVKIPSIKYNEDEIKIKISSIPLIDPYRTTSDMGSESNKKESKVKEKEYIYVLGDSTCVFPIIGQDMEYYLIGAFYGRNPVICIDNETLVGAITFDDEKAKVLKKKIP